LFACNLILLDLQDAWNYCIINGSIESLEVLKEKQFFGPKPQLVMNQGKYLADSSIWAYPVHRVRWDEKLLNGLVWCYEHKYITLLDLERQIKKGDEELHSNNPHAADYKTPLGRLILIFKKYLPLILAERGLAAPTLK